MGKHNWLKVEGFDELLNALAFSPPETQPDGQFTSVRICEERMWGTEIGPPAVDLWFPVALGHKLEGLHRLIEKGLDELGHPSSPAIVASLLPLVPLTSDASRGREKLAEIFSNFYSTSYTETFIMSLGQKTYRTDEQIIRIGDFVLQPFSAAPKMAAAVAAKSFFGAEGTPLEALEGNWAIERSYATLPFCDAGKYSVQLLKHGSRWSRDVDEHPEDVAFQLLDWLFFNNYCSEYQNLMVDQFLADLRHAQSTHVVFGGNYFSFTEAFGLPGCVLLNEWHDVSWNSSRGVMGGATTDLGLTFKLTNAFADFLLTLAPHSKTISRIDAIVCDEPILRTFSQLLRTAREQEQGGNLDVALLLCWTAIEYLLISSRADNIQAILKRRLGALVSLYRNLSFANEVERIGSLYDARSGFVHAAKEIESATFAQSFDLAKLAFIAALSVSIKHRQSEKGDWTHKWHILLDYLSSALAAGVTVDGAAVAEAGIDWAVPIPECHQPQSIV